MAYYFEIDICEWQNVLFWSIVFSFLPIGFVLHQKKPIFARKFQTTQHWNTFLLKQKNINISFTTMYWTLELASKLEDAPWPATREELLDYANRSGAPLEVIENLQEMEDEGEVYDSIEDLWPDYPQKDDFFFNEEEYWFENQPFSSKIQHFAKGRFDTSKCQYCPFAAFYSRICFPEMTVDDAHLRKFLIISIYGKSKISQQLRLNHPENRPSCKLQRRVSALHSVHPRPQSR